MPRKVDSECVSVTEGPYPVPGNWRWEKGNVLFKPMEVRRPIEKTFLYIDIDAIDNKRQIISAPKLLSVEKAPSRAVRGVQCGDTLFSMVRPYLKNIAFVSEQLKDAIASSGFYVCRPHQCADARYIYRLMTSPYVVDGLNEHMKGDNSPSIRKNDIEEFLFPVPPLSEQHRIVERVERLFAKLDAAKEKTQFVIDSCEKRKAAILHKAFTGELTAGWRKVNKKEYDWVAKKLSDCCQMSSGGTPSRKNPEFYHGQIPWIKTGEINWQDITDAEEKITEEAIEKSAAKLYAPGCVLVAMYGMGATRGRAAILKVPAATNQAVCVLQPDTTLNNRFLFYYFMCHYWNIRGLAVGGNQLNLSATIIGKFVIKLPSLLEQVEILRLLESLLSKECRVQSAAEQSLIRITSLKQSILARAFRGELGTNDPSELPTVL